MKALYGPRPDHYDRTRLRHLSRSEADASWWASLPDAQKLQARLGQEWVARMARRDLDGVAGQLEVALVEIERLTAEVERLGLELERVRSLTLAGRMAG